MGQRVVYPRAPQRIKKRPCRILSLAIAEVLNHAPLGTTTKLVLLCVDKALDPLVNACRMQSICRDQPQPRWGCC